MMSNCPECGEKVADNDVFCAYCGITLTPPAPVMADAEDPSMSATIVGTSADIVRLPEPVSEPDAAEADQPIPPPIPSPFADPLEADPFGFKAEPAFAAQVQSEPDSFPEEPAGIPVMTIETPAEIESSLPAPVDEAPTPKVILDLEAASSERVEAEPSESEAERVVIPEPVYAAPDQVTEVHFDVGDDFSNSADAESPASPAVAGSAPEISANAEPEPEIAEIAEPLVEMDEPEPDVAEIAEPVVEMAAVPSVQPQNDRADEIGATEADEMIAASPESGALQESVEMIQDEVAEPADETKPVMLESEPEPPTSTESNPMPAESIPAGDPDNVVTLEAPVPEFQDPDPIAVVPTPVPEVADEAQPGTNQNFGNADTDGRRSAKLKPLDEGVLLNNRYEIVRKIGGGGMGAVYLAKDRNLGEIHRAVKEMVQSYIEHEQQEKAVADFQREAMILTNLEHPAIPTIFDYFFDETEGRFYLVMKYISGGDLAARLRANPEGRLDEKTVTEWAIQVADVLEYLHRQDPVIVYRDLKPANVMIDGNSGRLMLIDFGIARSINKEEKGVTAVGTMGYAPPELFSGNVEPRSDIYSLGSTMFHLLTGADPQSNPLLIFDFQKNPRPRQINPQLSDQIEQILMRSVEYNADLRFRSANEMKRSLEEHLINLQAGKVSYGVKAAPSAVGFSEQLVFCGICGKQIVASDVFCAFCGSQQPIAQQSFHQVPVMAPPPVAVAATAKLYVVLTNDLETSGFTLERDDNLIGRRDPMSNIFPEVDLSKFDPQTKISRRHARIRREGSNFLLEDLGSSNGTILMTGNDSARLLPHQPRLLTNGDRFRVGDTTLQFAIA